MPRFRLKLLEAANELDDLSSQILRAPAPGRLRLTEDLDRLILRLRSVYLPHDIFGEVDRLAKESRRSLSAQITILVEAQLGKPRR